MPPGRASPWMPFPAQSEWTARTLQAGEREISGAPSVPHMFRCVCLCVCCEKSRECAVRSTLRLCHGTPPFPTSPGDNCKIFTPALVKHLHLPVCCGCVLLRPDVLEKSHRANGERRGFWGGVEVGAEAWESIGAVSGMGVFAVRQLGSISFISSAFIHRPNFALPPLDERSGAVAPLP